MPKHIDVTENIEECIEILDDFIKNEGKGLYDQPTAVNAMKYLKVTTSNSLSAEYEPRGCPNQNKIEKVK